MIETIGTIGALIILYTFVMNQLERLSADSFQYDVLNLLGSGLLVYYATSIGSVPFILINGVWALLSLKDVLAHIFRK